VISGLVGFTLVVGPAAIWRIWASRHGDDFGTGMGYGQLLVLGGVWFMALGLFLTGNLP
jgi:hypothetical protein